MTQKYFLIIDEIREIAPHTWAGIAHIEKKYFTACSGSESRVRNMLRSKAKKWIEGQGK